MWRRGVSLATVLGAGCAADAGVGVVAAGAHRGPSAGCGVMKGAAEIGVLIRATPGTGVGTRAATEANAELFGFVTGVGATEGELSEGVANADCKTPADALVTMTGNVPPLIAITPPHTEQRARTPLAGTFDGSILKIDRQSGQATVIGHYSGLPGDLRRTGLTEGHAT